MVAPGEQNTAQLVQIWSNVGLSYSTGGAPLCVRLC